MKSYHVLLEDATLKNVQEAYYEKFDEYINAQLLSGNGCTSTGRGWTKCKWNGPIPGELQYQQACVAAGGTTKTFSGNFACHLTDSAGIPSAIMVDHPIVVACVPSTIEMNACFESLLMDIIDVAETNRENMFENAVCTMGDLDMIGLEDMSTGRGSSSSS